MITADAPACPECGQPLQAGGLVLAKRVDDGQRVCRSLWRCPGRHTWWSWVDRPEEGLEVCPVPGFFH
ncbi:dehydrogenase [Streptomyces griseoluteus]|uniref:dehydrogenase n=1 Tax=Streptomyces griseoluteus TaxID=29306 RepID=UPI00382DD8C3